MKILIGGICGAIVGCVIFVVPLWLAVLFAPVDNLGREFLAIGLAGYVPYLAIIGALIGGVIGTKKVAARIPDSQWKSAASSRQP
jgi:gas vesicle protein